MAFQLVVFLFDSMLHGSWGFCEKPHRQTQPWFEGKFGDFTYIFEDKPMVIQIFL